MIRVLVKGSNDPEFLSSPFVEELEEFLIKASEEFNLNIASEMGGTIRVYRAGSTARVKEGETEEKVFDKLDSAGNQARTS